MRLWATGYLVHRDGLSAKSRRDSVSNWPVYHSSLTAQYIIYLNHDASVQSSTQWNAYRANIFRILLAIQVVR
jgi:hypothetical protein